MATVSDQWVSKLSRTPYTGFSKESDASASLFFVLDNIPLSLEVSVNSIPTFHSYVKYVRITPNNQERIENNRRPI